MSEENQSVADLTKLMLFFGKLSEVHVNNIKSFPFIYFNEHTADPKVDYSVATTDKSQPTVFSYELSLNLEANDHLNKRYKGLETAIRKLFWKEAKVEIKINGEEVYKSE